MNILSYPCSLTAPTAVALGRFDGVHPAHREVICAAAACKERHLTPAVFTFCDNPGKSHSGLLTTQEEKHTLIQDIGAEIIVNAAFDSVRNLSPQEFVQDVLVSALNAKAVFCGYNYRFGKGAAADAEALKALCKKAGITVTCVDEVLIEGSPVSSTAIRKLLTEGQLASANKLLGRRYSLSGTVVHGRGLGRTIDTPTLNIDVDKSKLLPKFGVYATYVHMDGVTCKAVTNIGVKPTVGSDTPTVEAYLLDFSGNFYEKTATLELVSFLRSEEAFDSLQELKAAIERDIEKAQKILT